MSQIKIFEPLVISAFSFPTISLICCSSILTLNLGVLAPCPIKCFIELSQSQTRSSLGIVQRRSFVPVHGASLDGFGFACKLLGQGGAVLPPLRVVRFTASSP